MIRLVVSMLENIMLKSALILSFSKDLIETSSCLRTAENFLDVLRLYSKASIVIVRRFKLLPKLDDSMLRHICFLLYQIFILVWMLTLLQLFFKSLLKHFIYCNEDGQDFIINHDFVTSFWDFRVNILIYFWVWFYQNSYEIRNVMQEIECQ